jgi:hypothetical protein
MEISKRTSKGSRPDPGAVPESGRLCIPSSTGGKRPKDGVMPFVATLSFGRALEDRDEPPPVMIISKDILPVIPPAGDMIDGILVLDP